MELCTKHLLRPLTEVAFLSLIAAFALTLWQRAISTTIVTPQPVAESDDWDPTAGGLDFTARERVGVASFYASQFFWKRMADGARMNPHGNNAASRTLPLGTVAKVTDVATGKSALVKIEDRGPYVKGRIVDLSPSIARDIGITSRIGIAKVVVTPITVPLPSGSVKISPAARENDLRLATAMASTNSIR
jgi:rare lipoprotein A (peptidoglycan hydrolase)